MKKTILALSLIFIFLLSSCTENIPQITDTADNVTEAPETDKVTESVTEEPETETTQPVINIPKEPVIISFVGMGDNLIHSPIFKQSLLSNGKYDFLPKYKSVASVIKNADIAFVNQETPMCGEKYGYHNYPQFNTPGQMGHDLVTLGFDVVCFANNHVLDQNSQGLEDMLEFTNTLGAVTLGAYKNEDDASQIRVLECEGVKISFLAYTYGTNIKPSSSSETVVPLIDEDRITRDVKKAHEVSDFIIVSMHWGEENKSKLSDMQTHYSQLLANLGVDVILGHHPHVIQPIEWINGESGNKTLCYYSLGNSINNQDRLRNMVGIMASFDIVCEENKRPYIKNAGCIPTFCHQTAGYKNTALYLLSDLTDNMAKSHHSNGKGDNVTVKNAYKMVTNVITEEFLPDYLKADGGVTNG